MGLSFELLGAQCHRIGEKANPHYLAALAAAYAEAGDFSAAIAEQAKVLEDKALWLLPKLHEEMENRMKLYRSKKSYRDIE